MTIEQLYQIYLQHPSVETDTRKLKKGDIFFALKGDNFNGNEFALQALEQGAAYAVIEEDVESNNPHLLKVENVLSMLQALAKHHRKQFSIPFIAVTGSNGKTTTKELIHAVLNTHYITYTTQGNLNNHIGIPLTILRIKSDAEVAIIEMGANHQKEIEGYCNYTYPTHGIITNCGKAHLEGFGGEEGVRKGKGELYDYIQQNKGTVFAFDDYSYLHAMSKNIENVIWYGTQQGEVRGEVNQAEPFLNIRFNTSASFTELQTQLVGAYNLPNVLCAVAVGKYFKVPEEKIKQAIENYSPDNSRSQLITKDTNKVILDAYNANPSSMKAAIENFAKITADTKMLFLGGMMELGEVSIEEHEQLISLINQYKWTKVILVGGDFKKIKHSYQYFDTSAQAKEWFIKSDITNAYILLKGSRSMQMEKLIQ